MMSFDEKAYNDLEFDLMVLECTRDYNLCTGSVLLETFDDNAIVKFFNTAIEKIIELIEKIADKIKELIDKLFKKQQKTSLEKLMKNEKLVKQLTIEVYDFNKVNSIWKSFNDEIVKLTDSIPTYYGFGINPKPMKYTMKLDQCYDKYHDMLQDDVIRKPIRINGKEAVTYIEKQWSKDIEICKKNSYVMREIEQSYRQYRDNYYKSLEAKFNAERKIAKSEQGFTLFRATVTKMNRFSQECSSVVYKSCSNITSALSALNIDNIVINNVAHGFDS